MSILSNNFDLSLELDKLRNRFKEIDYKYDCIFNKYENKIKRLEFNCPYCQDNSCDCPCYQELDFITHTSYPIN